MTVQQFANQVKTYLAVPLQPTDLALTIVPVANAPSTGEFRVRIGLELLIVTAVVGTTWTVTRGAEGTTAVAHPQNSPVTVVLTAGALQALRAEIESEIDASIAADLPLSAVRYADNGTLVPIANQNGNQLEPYGTLHAAVADAGGQVIYLNPGAYAPEGALAIARNVVVSSLGLPGSLGSNIDATTIDNARIVGFEGISFVGTLTAGTAGNTRLDDCVTGAVTTGGTLLLNRSTAIGVITAGALTATDSTIVGAVNVSGTVATFNHCTFAGPHIVTFTGAAGVLALNDGSYNAFIASGGTVVNGTITSNDFILLAPLGGGSDDGPRIMAAIESVSASGAGRVTLRGAFTVTTAIRPKNNVTLEIPSGSTINYSLPFDLPNELITYHNAEMNLRLNTTVTAPAAVGARFLALADTTGYAIGDYIICGSITGSHSYRITAIGGLNVTLDSPLWMALAITDPVSVYDPLIDFHVVGSGKITGSFHGPYSDSRVMELLATWYCSYEDLDVTVTGATSPESILGFDQAGRDNWVRRCHLTGTGQANKFGLIFEQQNGGGVENLLTDNVNASLVLSSGFGIECKNIRGNDAQFIARTLGLLSDSTVDGIIGNLLSAAGACSAVDINGGTNNCRFENIDVDGTAAGAAAYIATIVTAVSPSDITANLFRNVKLNGGTSALISRGGSNNTFDNITAIGMTGPAFVEGDTGAVSIGTRIKGLIAKGCQQAISLQGNSIDAFIDGVNASACTDKTIYLNGTNAFLKNVQIDNTLYNVNVVENASATTRMSNVVITGSHAAEHLIGNSGTLWLDNATLTDSGNGGAYCFYNTGTAYIDKTAFFGGGGCLGLGAAGGLSSITPSCTFDAGLAIKISPEGGAINIQQTGALAAKAITAGNVTLSVVDMYAQTIEVTGILTGDTNLIDSVPCPGRFVNISNGTTAIHTLTIKASAADPGIALTQGKRRQFTVSGAGTMVATGAEV